MSKDAEEDESEISEFSDTWKRESTSKKLDETTNKKWKYKERYLPPHLYMDANNSPYYVLCNKTISNCHFETDQSLKKKE